MHEETVVRGKAVAILGIVENETLGSRRNDVPTISVTVTDLLTWNEARDLARKLSRLVDLAEFG